MLRKLPNGNQLASSLDNDPELVDYVLNSENFRIDNGLYNSYMKCKNM